jgi:hypothetical protein
MNYLLPGIAGMYDERKNTGVIFSEAAWRRSDKPARDLLRAIVNDDGFHPEGQRFFQDQFGIDRVADHPNPKDIDFLCYGESHLPLWELDVKHKEAWTQEDDFPWADVQVEPRSVPHIGPRTLFVYFSATWRQAIIIPPEAFRGKTREVPNYRDDNAAFSLADARYCWLLGIEPPSPAVLMPAWMRPDDLPEL